MSLPQSSNSISRRQFTQTAWGAGAAATLAAAGGSSVGHAVEATGTAAQTDGLPIRYCLNTSTIRGQKLPLPATVDRVAAAGYDGIEPWIREIQEYQESGGSLDDLRKRIADAGLTVDSAIGFATWIVDDPAQRAQGLESMKRDMALVRAIGGTRIAAPPVGATEQTDLNLSAAAERYARLLELGRAEGVVPQLEVWGFSKSLSRLGEVLHVAIDAGDADACLLPDVYHLYKGGNPFPGLALVPGSAIQVMHLNDYPDIPRETIGDKDRVYPGDGIAPVARIIAQLVANGFDGTFSLELFNPSYWEQPVDNVLRTGLAKMQAVVAASRSEQPWRGQ